MSNQVIDKPQVEQKESVKPNFGTGKYSQVGESFFNAVQFFNVVKDVKQAEKVARAYMSDLGRLNLNVTNISVSKPTKDNYVNVRENGEVKKITGTPSLNIKAIVQVCETLYKMGVHRIEGIQLNETLTTWLNS